jgi:hypothetical protein
VLYKGKARLATENEFDLAIKSIKLSELDEKLSNSNLNQLKVFIFNDELSTKFNVLNENRFLNFIYTSESQLMKSRLYIFLIQSERHFHYFVFQILNHYYN